jgi:hypothetical protein
MKAIFTWFEKFDIIGPEFNFERNGTSRFKTVQGSFLSLIIIVAAIVLAFQFGRDIYQRKLPNVSSSREFINISEIYMQDFPMMLSFYSNNALQLNYNSTFDGWVEEFILFDEKNNIIKHNLVNCKEMLPKFRKHRDLVSRILLSSPDNYYCLNFTENIKFQNEFIGPNSSFIGFHFKYCEKEERSDCHHDPLLLNSSLNVAITYIDNFVDSTSYSNPVKPFVTRIASSISSSFSKALIISFTNNEYVSDNGWLVEDIKKTNYVQLSAQSSEVLLRKENNNKVFELFLSSPRLRIKDKRVYLKVQELFARIGGIVNGFIIVMNILSFHYLRFKYFIFVWKNSFNIIDEEYVINMKRKDKDFLNIINKDKIK